MKRLVLVLILGLVTTYMVPVLLPRLNQVPHHHVLVGNVSAAALEAHLQTERAEPTPTAPATQLSSGFILSIPFGDWLSFYANLGMCLLAAAGWIGVVAFHTRILIHAPLHASLLPRLTVPPPRFV